MQTMNISLPHPLKSFVERQIAAGRYSSASEYVRELIRADEARRRQDQLETLLAEGLASGEPGAMTDRDWADIRSEAARLYERRRSRSTL